MTNKPNPADFSPTVPDFPSIGQYQPIYGKFDLTTYIQGASDYEIMAFLVQCYNATLKGYSDVTKLSKDTVTAYNQLQTWVNTWFDELDVQQEINNKLQSMYEAGTLANAIAQSNAIAPAVAQYLNSVEGTQNLSNVTAQKIEAMSESGALWTVINNTGTVQSTTTNWLQQNVTPTGSAVMVDKSLTIGGAAADAKAVDNKAFLIRQFKSADECLEAGLFYSISDQYTQYNLPFLGPYCTLLVITPTTGASGVTQFLITTSNNGKQVMYRRNKIYKDSGSFTDFELLTDSTLSKEFYGADAKTIGDYGFLYRPIFQDVSDNDMDKWVLPGGYYADKDTAIKYGIDDGLLYHFIFVSTKATGTYPNPDVVQIAIGSSLDTSEPQTIYMRTSIKRVFGKFHPIVDTTLGKTHIPADAKAVGDSIRELKAEISGLPIYTKPKVLFIGDSFTDNNVGVKSYVSFLNEYGVCDGVNQGHSGATSHTWYTNWLNTITNEYDTFFIALGLNGNNLGTIDDANDADTFCGGMNGIIETILTVNPKARVILWCMDAWLDPQRITLTKKLADKWGTEYYSMKSDANIPIRINGKLDGVMDGLQESVVNAKNKAFKVSDDNAHPNNDAQKLLANYLRKII